MITAKPWLESKDLPLFDSADGESMEKAQRMRERVVEWLNEEIRQAYIAKMRSGDEDRFRMLKKFAGNIKTSAVLRAPKYWADHISDGPDELFKEYCEKREARKAGR